MNTFRDLLEVHRDCTISSFFVAVLYPNFLLPPLIWLVSAALVISVGVGLLIRRLAKDLEEEDDRRDIELGAARKGEP